MAEYTYSFTYDGPFDQVSRIGIGNRTLAQDGGRFSVLSRSVAETSDNATD